MEVEEELGIVFSELSDCVSEFICNFNEIGTADSKALANKAGEILTLLEDGSEHIGKKDAQYVGDYDLSKGLQDLMLEASKNNPCGGIKFMLKMLQNKIEHFKRLLNSEWNQNVAKTFREKNKTPTKENGESKVVYKKVTPLKVKKEYKCTEDGCNKMTTNLTVYKRHMKEAHDKEAGAVEEVKVSCMMQSTKKKRKGEVCNSKLPLSGMYRHLEDVHKKPRPSDDMYLRFFKSCDGGKTFIEPLYLLKSDADPDCILDDPRPTTGMKNLTEEVENPSGSNSLTAEAEAESARKGDDIGEVGNPNGSNRPTAEAEAESAKKGDDNGGVQNKSVSSPDQTMNDDGDQDLTEVVPEADCEKSKLDEGSILKDMFPDAVFDDEENTEEAESDEISLTEDSDEEEGEDEAEFTNKRLANKKKRYKKRNQSDLFHMNLWEEEGNVSVLEDFDDFLKTVKYASNANKKSSTFGKSLGHVAKYHDSFLKHHRERNPDFRLDRLTSFKSPSFLLLPEPISWMNSIAGSGQEQPTRR